MDHSTTPTADYGCLPTGEKCCFTAKADCKQCGDEARRPSKFFGCQGELWSPRDRLVYEWSWAGYMQGSAEPPRLPVTVNLKDK